LKTAVNPLSLSLKFKYEDHRGIQLRRVDVIVAKGISLFQ